METSRLIKIISGPFAGAICYVLLLLNNVDHKIASAAMVTVWMAVWWVTEPHDLGITSLVPFIMFPLLGIMDAAKVASQYMEQTIFLFIGGFFIAYAMEKHNLHQRVAYKIIVTTGGTPARILAGIMITTYFISMWISNTATTMMLFAAVISIVKHDHIFHEQLKSRIATVYLIALAYSSSIGGMATLVGTPTNMVLAGMYEKLIPGAAPISFYEWSGFAFPFSLAFLILGFIILRILFIPQKLNLPFEISYIKKDLEQLGKFSPDEKKIVILFTTTVILWFTRVDIDAGFFKISGWSNYLPNGVMIKDSTIAAASALVLFLIPSKHKPTEMILEWDDIKKLPLNIILLFGSGFALAEGFTSSGLANLLSKELIFLSGLPMWAIVGGIAVIITVLSEFASNVASIQLILPVLLPLCLTLNIEPKLLMIPATIAASFGFMLPVATAPNTIVYGTGYIPVKSLLRAGLVFNLTGILLLTIFAYFFY